MEWVGAWPVGAVCITCAVGVCSVRGVPAGCCVWWGCIRPEEYRREWDDSELSKTHQLNPIHEVSGLATKDGTS